MMAVSNNSADQTIELTPLHSELLCFVADKVKSMPVNSIVKICGDFYKEDEVIASRDMINLHCSLDPQQRLCKRKDPDRLRKTLEDILSVFVDPSVKLPLFYAVDLSRLPPVDVTHCDVAMILKELSNLRQEVRAVAELREEVVQMRALLHSAGSASANLAIATGSKIDAALPGFAAAPAHSRSYADTIKQNIEVINDDKAPIALKQRRVFKSTVGSSTLNTKLTAVPTIRIVDLFVSRLLPGTTDEELKECVMAANDVDSPVHVVDVACTKLKSRFEQLYCSYHVQISIVSVDMKRAIDVFMSESSWPQGIFVRRYFKPKSPANSPSDW